VGLNVTLKRVNFSNRRDNLKRQISRAVKSNKLLEEVAQDILTDVKGQAQSGRNPDGSKYPSLSSSWVERRKRLSTTNKVSGLYAPRRSNVTFTGEFIDSIKARINKSKGTIAIEATGTHSKYRGIRKRTVGSKVKNADLATFLAEKGRNVIALRDTLLERIRSKIRRFVRDEIRKT
jgi:hypothetical protein